MDAKQAMHYTLATLNGTDEIDNAHYHVGDGTDLTIIAGLHDLKMHLIGEIEDRAGDMIGEVSIDASCGILSQKIVVTGGSEDTQVTYRINACDDPTCWKVLQDHWL
jgi:hypothetical protein